MIQNIFCYFSESSINCSSQTCVLSFVVGKKNHCKLSKLQKAFCSQPAWEMVKDRRIEHCSLYAQHLMWGNEYIKPCANLVKLVQTLVFVKQFGFGLLCLSCKTPFFSAEEGSVSNPSQRHWNAVASCFSCQALLGLQLVVLHSLKYGGVAGITAHHCSAFVRRGLPVPSDFFSCWDPC